MGTQFRTAIRRVVAGIVVVGSVATVPLLAQPASAAPRPAGQADPPPVLIGLRDPAPDAEFAEVAAAASASGRVRAIVTARTDLVPEGRLNRAGVERQRADNHRRSDGLRRHLAAGRSVIRTLDSVPTMVVELTPAEVAELQASGEVADIMVDEATALPTDANSDRVVHHTDPVPSTYGGSGQTVAILDTGIDRAHRAFGSRVVSEACFSSNMCPDGTASQTGTGSAAPCRADAAGVIPNGCGHGTHVAGIAAGQAGVTTAAFGSKVIPAGVAPQADIIAVNVFSRFAASKCKDTSGPCVKAFVSDQLSGLQRVLDQTDTRRIAAVNMSLGGGRSTGPCDSAPLKGLIDQLLSEGTATVISSGNDSFRDAVGEPGCISTAVTVGNTDGDTIAFDSNMSSQVDLLAPGAGVVSAIPGGDVASKWGTSMAAPHVTGALAVVRSADPTLAVAGAVHLLQSTGTVMSDDRPAVAATDDTPALPKGSVIAARINLRAASRDNGSSRAGDFNGDGRDDVVSFLRGAEGSSPVSVALSAGTKLNPATVWYPSMVSLPGVPGVGDVNGDGRDDILSFRRGEVGNVWVALSDGSKFLPATVWATGFATGFRQPLVGDVNGDRRDDIVQYTTVEGAASSLHTAVLRVRLSNGSGFGGSTDFGSFPTFGSEQPDLADVTGDRKADLVLGTAFNTMVLPSAGTAFSPKSINATAVFGARRGAADVNGDGRADLVTFDQAGSGQIKVALSAKSATGVISLTPPVVWGSVTAGWSNFRPTVGLADVSGDGKADVTTFTQSSTNDVNVNLSTGSAFGALSKWLEIFAASPAVPLPGLRS